MFTIRQNQNHARSYQTRTSDVASSYELRVDVAHLRVREQKEEGAAPPKRRRSSTTPTLSGRIRRLSPASAIRRGMPLKNSPRST